MKSQFLQKIITSLITEGILRNIFFLLFMLGIILINPGKNISNKISIFTRLYNDNLTNKYNFRPNAYTNIKTLITVESLSLLEIAQLNKKR